MRVGSVGAGSDHQALDGAAELAVERGDGEVGLLEDVAEVVDEHLVVGRQRAAERAAVRVGVDGDDAVAPQRGRAASPSSTVSVVLPTPPLGETTAIVAQRVRRGAAIVRSSRPM